MNLYTLKGVILDSNSEPKITLWKVFRAASYHPHKNVITNVRNVNSNSITYSKRMQIAINVCIARATAPNFVPFLSVISP